MKTHFVRFTMYATFAYLTGFTLNSAVTASEPYHITTFKGYTD